MNYDVICTESRTPEWHAARKQGLGSSDVAAVLGLSPWKSPYALWAEKTGKLDTNQEETEALIIGREFESFCIRHYERKTGRHSRKCDVMYRSTSFPWALATIDAWARENDDDIVLEIKTTSERFADDWVDGPPPHVNAQVQHQLMVVGGEKASVACLLGKKFIWCDVPRDEALVKRIQDAGEKFWECVVTDKAPQADGHATTIAAIRAIYPVEDGSEIALPASFLDVFDEIELLEQQKKDADRIGMDLKAKILDLKTVVEAELGNARKGYLPDGRMVERSIVKRKAYQAKETEWVSLKFGRV